MRISKDKITFSCIGLGGRASVYLNALRDNHANDFSLVAVAEPDEEKRKRFQREFGVTEELAFCSDEEFLKRERLSDVVIVATQDRLHYRETLALLGKGYDIILEKPISADLKEVADILRVSKQHPNQLVAVCHVLRHTVFFNALRDIVRSNRLGRVVSIQHNENIGYYHFAHSYVRGSWNSAEKSAPLIIAKSCHDMDILLYLLAGDRCSRVASYGGLKIFTHENFDRAVMSERCTDCSLIDTCPYSAVRIYSGDKIKSMVFDSSTHEEYLRRLSESPYGRCVYACDNDVADHQSTILEFDSGVTATFNLCAFTAKVNRSIKIMCEFGEIRGIEKPYEIEYTDFRTDKTTRLNLNISEGGHGGGDKGFVDDFMKSYLSGGDFNSTLEKSVESHVMAFLAEQSRINGGESKSVKEFMEKI